MNVVKDVVRFFTFSSFPYWFDSWRESVKVNYERFYLMNRIFLKCSKKRDTQHTHTDGMRKEEGKKCCLHRTTSTTGTSSSISLIVESNGVFNKISKWHIIKIVSSPTVGRQRKHNTSVFGSQGEIYSSYIIDCDPPYRNLSYSYTVGKRDIAR